MWLLNMLTSLLAWLAPAVGLAGLFLALAMARNLERRDAGPQAFLQLQTTLAAALRAFASAHYSLRLAVLCALALCTFFLFHGAAAAGLVVAGALAPVVVEFIVFSLCTLAPSRILSAGGERGRTPLAALIAAAASSVAVFSLILLLGGALLAFTEDAKAGSAFALAAFGAGVSALFFRLHAGVYRQAAYCARAAAADAGHGTGDNSFAHPAVPALIAADIAAGPCALAGSTFAAILACLAACTVLAAQSSPGTLAALTGFIPGGAGTRGIAEAFLHSLLAFPLVVILLGSLSALLGIRTLTRAGGEEQPAAAESMQKALVAFLALACVFVLLLSSLKFRAWFSLLAGASVSYATFLFAGQKLPEIEAGPRFSNVAAASRAAARSFNTALAVVFLLAAANFFSGTFGIAWAALASFAAAPLAIAVCITASVTEVAASLALAAHISGSGGERETSALLARLGAKARMVICIQTVLTGFALYFAFLSGEPAANRPDAAGIQHLIMLVLGVLLVFLVLTLLVIAALKAGAEAGSELARQYLEIPGLSEGRAGVAGEKWKFISSTARAGAKKIILPALVLVFLPLMTFLLAGKGVAAGIVLGAIVACLVLSLFLREIAEESTTESEREGNGERGAFARGLAEAAESIIELVPLTALAFALLL